MAAIAVEFLLHLVQRTHRRLQHKHTPKTSTETAIPKHASMTKPMKILVAIAAIYPGFIGVYSLVSGRSEGDSVRDLGTCKNIERCIKGLEVTQPIRISHTKVGPPSLAGELLEDIVSDCNGCKCDYIKH